ncbi:MAG: YceI family protein [Saprospiraceae bacterium]
MMKYGVSILLLSLTVFYACKNNTEVSPANEAQAVAEASGKSFTVSAAASKVLWKGYKPTGEHYGTFPVSKGSLSVENGIVTAGSFTIDLANLTVDDLEGDQKAKLEKHMKGTGTDGNEDFFNVSKYPTARFDITKITGLANDSTGNALVYGNLTLLDVTKEVNFKANINILDNNVTVVSAPFKINRTDWGLKYKSKSFADLKDKFINDEVDLQVNLNASVTQ